MKLLATLTAEQFEKELPEDLAENYTLHEPDDGEPYYGLTVEGYEPTTALGGLKTALERERDNAKSATRQVMQLKEKLTNATSQLEELSTTASDTKEATGLKKKVGVLIKTLEAAVRDVSIAEALAEHGGTKALGKAYVADKVQVLIDDEGATSFVEYDREKLSVSEYVGLLKSALADKTHPLHDMEMAVLFKSGVKSGGGTPPGGNTSGSKGSKIVPSNLRRSAMTTKDKVSFIREHGEDAFINLQT